MSQKNISSNSEDSSGIISPFIKVVLLGAGAGLLALMAFVAIFLFIQSPIAATMANAANFLFGLQTAQLMWYVTRAAGIMAYLLLWLSTAWGLAVSSKILDNLLHRSFTYDFHQFISLLSIGFLALHIIVLSADKYMPYSLAQMLFPFISPYRPLWVGIGVIAFYLILLVTVTFYMKSKIGMKAFRTIHVLSLLGYFGAVAHSFFSGTDSPLAVTIIMYGGTFLSVIFLFVYWLMTALQKKATQKRPVTVAGMKQPVAARR